MASPAEQDLALPEWRSDMYYTYVLKSLVNGDVYIGYSENLRTRLEYHNSGRVRSTKGYKPWILVYYEAYLNKFDAAGREKQLKTHAAKSSLEKQISRSLTEANGKINR
ncbi:MAG: GIY-YIG nuclease family protein [Patescibacteria group bacterium]